MLQHIKKPVEIPWLWCIIRAGNCTLYVPARNPYPVSPINANGNLKKTRKKKEKARPAFEANSFLIIYMQS